QKYHSRRLERNQRAQLPARCGHREIRVMFKSGKREMARKQAKRRVPTALSKDAVLAHLAAHPGDTKRDLARAMGIKGAERQALKRILNELSEEGTIERGKQRSSVPVGGLPEVAVLEVYGEDPDGELLGRPVEWSRDEPTPSVLILPGRDESGPSLGRGERVLARIARSKEGAIPYEARIIKRL